MAHQILGVEQKFVKILDFPVRNFGQFRQEILQVLIDINKHEVWEKIFLPSSQDIHQDHQVLATEAIRAFKTHSLFGYELPWNNIESRINSYNTLSKEEVKLKINALAQFNSQRHRFYMNPELIESSLRFRGMQILRDYCESFELIRLID